MKKRSHILFYALTVTLFVAVLILMMGIDHGEPSLESALERSAQRASRSPAQESDTGSRASLSQALPARSSISLVDPWGDAEVIALRRLPIGANGGRARLQRIVKRESQRYPILVEEELVFGPDGESILERRSIDAKAADHFLLMPNARITRARLQDELSSMGLTVGERLSESGPFLVFIEEMDWAIDAVSSLVANLNGPAFDDWVAYSEFDFVRHVASVPNDTLYRAGDMWALRNDGSRSGSIEGVDIGAEEGWEIRAAAAGVVVAVVDTGVRYTHEDLSANMWVNALEIEGNGIDDDGNGYVDDIHGINALYAPTLSIGGDPNDDNGHGTHVAGTLGAVGNNGIGITGVAWDVQLMALKFLGEAGDGMDSDAIKCIDYAIENGAHIINSSWGGEGVNKALEEAVSRANEAGVIFVAAAGNGGDDLDVEVFYPAGIDLPNVVAVGNHDHGDKVHPSSNYGKQTIDLMAPGTRIQSISHLRDSSYRIKTGTSMATPHVSGILALVKAEYPEEDSARLIERLLQGAVAVDQYKDLVRTGARANLAGALSIEALAPSSPSMTTVFGLDGAAVLAWQHQWTGEIDGFRIERSMNGSEWEVLAELAPETRSFEDRELRLLANNEYRAIAYNAHGDSLPSHRAILNAAVRGDARVILSLPQSDEGIAYGQAMDASENVLAVGASKDDDAGEESGSVYLYDRMPGSSWQYRQKLIGSDVDQYDYFGYSLSVEGSVMGVGAFGDDEGGVDTGAVYVFEQGSLGLWREVGKLKPLDSSDHDRFGFSVSVHGNRLAASARDDDDRGANSGSVYLFERDGLGRWIQEAKLLLPNDSERAYFGWSLALGEEVLAVGAKGDDESGVDAGAVYVYRYAGGHWALEQKIAPENLSSYDGFGMSMDFDGDSIAVGAPNRDSGEVDSGSVFLYRWNGSRWALNEMFEALEPERGGHFGWDLAVDGNRVAAVGLRNGESDTIAHVFEENALGDWENEKALFGKNVVPIIGRSVALSEGVVSAGNADAGELQSLYWVPDSLLSLDVEGGPAGALLSWRSQGVGNERVVVERRLAGTDDWDILGTAELGESSFLDRSAIGNRQWEYQVSLVSGGISAASDAVVTPLLPPARLVNLSARGYVGSGERVLIPGFAISGSGELDVAIRARGPVLLDYGIENAITDPRMSVIGKGGVSVASNDDWFEVYSADEMRQLEASTGAGPVGLFASESVYRGSLANGVFTVLIDDVSGEQGLGLAELFEVPNDEGIEEAATLVNLSARGFVDTGDNVLIGGFVISGGAPLQVLARGVGPGLSSHGIEDILDDPRITVYDSSGLAIDSNSDWEAGGLALEIEEMSAELGAFSLEGGSKDAALAIILPPGLYTVVLDSTDGSSGVGLLELYAAP